MGKQREQHYQSRGNWWSDEAPYFANTPNCLLCNWDWHSADPNERWPYAAFAPGPTVPREKRPDRERYWVWDRNYVAWLCEECAPGPESLADFASVVKRRYPAAVFVKDPGTAREQVIEPGPAERAFLQSLGITDVRAT